MDTLHYHSSKGTDTGNVFHNVAMSSHNVKIDDHMVKGRRTTRIVPWGEAVRKFGTEDRVRELARAAQFSSGAASNWKARGNIPHRTYEALVAQSESPEVLSPGSDTTKSVFSDDRLYTEAVRSVTQLTTGARWDLIHRLQSLLGHLTEWEAERVKMDHHVNTSGDTTVSQQLERTIARLREVETRTGGQGETWDRLLRAIQDLVAKGLGDSEDSGHGDHETDR